MSLRSRIVSWIAGKELAAIQARYDAAYWSATRSWIPASIQGAREDINTMSRQEILRRVRYFEKNSNVMKKALSILSVNVVGTGITPTPATGDDSWNKAALEWWTKWGLVADLTGTATISEMQDIAYRAQNVDGDHGIELTLSDSGRPALNLIESHRITTAGLDVRQLEAQGFHVVDGVLIDARGRPQAYTVASDFDPAKVSVIPASSFVLFYTKRRAGQYRGMSLFDGAILDLHDLDDLQRFEMLAAKDAASTSKVVKTPAGAATVGGEGIGRSLTTQPVVQSGDPQEYYRKAFGGETRYMLPGDSYEQFKSERPSAATTGFWDKLENKFVQGSGLSYAALCDYRGNWGGATLRAAVTSDNRLFSLRTTEQARRWQRVWEYAIGWAIEHGELPANPDFACVRWHPPRRTTVDIGNESAATINELRTGLRTFEATYGEAGDDWRERLEQRAIEEAYIDELAEKYDVPAVRISSFAQERMTAVAPAEPGAAPAASAAGAAGNDSAAANEEEKAEGDQ